MLMGFLLLEWIVFVVFCSIGHFNLVIIIKKGDKNLKELRNIKLNPANIKHKKKKYLLEKS